MRIYQRLLLLFTLVTNALAMSSKATSRSPNPVIKAMANGMNLLKPAFVAEANLQAKILGSSEDAVEVAKEIETELKRKPIVIYTYALSPFSSEALAILDSTGYDFEQIELGAEWFLLGGKNSVKRVLLSLELDSGATSLPKVFVNGKCLGGCAELAEAVESGTLDGIMAAKKGKKLLPFL